MVDWLSICRRCGEACRVVVADLPRSSDRSRRTGRGEGGDWTVEVDRLCEDAVFAELEKADWGGGPLLAISEERGEVLLGPAGAGDPAARIVIDPIDGSLNARRTLPAFSLSIAVASGPTMADVDFGYVYDFGTDLEYSAVRGGGALVAGDPLIVEQPGHDLLEVIGLESTEPGRVAAVCERLEGKVLRLRAIGSVALSLCYVATARLDGFITLRACRSVDAAAGQLIVREAGGALRFRGIELEDADLGLEARYDMGAALRDDHLATLLDAQEAVDPGT
jgi:myo-inositol-1(or 4)-monophosphatase